MKKIISFLSVVLVLVLFFNVSAFASPALSWYCVRNLDHKQPKLDANMSFITEYNGYYVDPGHGDSCEDKVVYLTFDAGYENGNVAKILDILKEKEAPGAFFILGNLIKRNPDLIKRMAAEGHIVANHTTHHKDVTQYATMSDFQKDVETLEDLYKQTTGFAMAKYFRPPEGKFSEQSMRFAKDLGYTTVFWSIAYADWDNAHQPTEAHAMSKILDHMHNGAIILLHPTSATNTRILGRLIDELRTQGYRFGAITELNAS